MKAPPCGSSISIIQSMVKLALESTSISSSNNNNTRVSDDVTLPRKEVLYDLGCGDGRVCLEAYWHCYEELAQEEGRQCDLQCVGVEIEEDLVTRFQDLIDQLSLPSFKTSGEEQDHSSKIHAIHGDLCQVLESLLKRKEDRDDGGDSSDSKKYSDLPIPTIITLYLLPEAIKLIQPILIKMLQTMKPLTIICNTWGMNKEVTPSKVVDALDEETGNQAKLFIYQ